MDYKLIVRTILIVGLLCNMIILHSKGSFAEGVILSVISMAIGCEIGSLGEKE